MIWINEEEKDRLNKQALKLERYLIGFDLIPDSKPNPHENKKWAWVEIHGERQMQWVNNQTMKAYERNGYEPTDIEITEFKFERWCRPHDL